MIELIMVVAMPFLVKISTGAVKQLGVIANAAAWRVPVIRAVVAVFSLIGAILTASIGEGTLEPGMVETTAYTVLNAGVATWLYWRSKQQ